MSDEYGPWVEHDGAAPNLPLGVTIMYEFSPESGRVEPPAGYFEFDSCPNFFWRWRTVRDGWFGKKKIRVCDDPEYMPIIRYRIRKPRGLVILEKLIADLPADPMPAVEAASLTAPCGAHTSPPVANVLPLTDPLPGALSNTGQGFAFRAHGAAHRGAGSCPSVSPPILPFPCAVGIGAGGF